MKKLSLPASKKARLALCCAAVLLIAAVVLVLVFSLIRPKGTDEVLFGVISDPGAGETLIYRGEEPLYRLEGFLKSRATAFGGERDAVLTDLGQFCLMTPKFTGIVSEDVLDFRLACEGGALVYLTGDHALYYQKDGAREATCLMTDYPADTLDALAVSPKGGCVALGFSEEDGALQLWKNGTFTPLSDALTEDGCRPLAVSEDGEHLYYLTGADSALYHASASGSCRKLTASFSASFLPPRFNRDVSEVLFSEANGCTYFSENGGEKEKVSPGAASPVPLSGSRTFSQAGSVPCEILPEKSLQDRLYLVKKDDAQSLKLFSDGWAGTTCASDVYAASLSADARTLYFVRSAENTFRIYTVDLRKEDAREETLVATGVSAYSFSPDGKTVYYVTRGRKLYGRSGADSVLMCENASGVSVAPTGEVYWNVELGEGLSVWYLYLNEERGSVRLSESVSASLFTREGAYFCVKQDRFASWYVRTGETLKALQHP